MSALARIRKTALQHEQERQYDKALALYARLLDGAEAGEEEVDVGLFNRAGDLALRVGDTPRALGYFERALDLYAAGGLLNNAVALGVKILRHAPGHLSAHYTLGVLYGRKGFAGDARHHLLTYAVQMQRAGRADEAARVIAEVAAGCHDAADRRLALDAYGALGGDPAQAAALAGEPAAVSPSPAPAVVEEEAGEWGVVDLQPEALDVVGASEPFAAEVLLTADAPPSAADGPPAEWDVLELEQEFGVADEPITPGGAVRDDEVVGVGAPSLVFLDMEDEAADAPVAGGPAVAEDFGVELFGATPRWPDALPDEPPPLRLAELLRVDEGAPAVAVAEAPSIADVVTVHAEAPADYDDPLARALDSALDLPPVRYADLLAVELGDAAPAPDAPAGDPLDLGAWLRDTMPAPSTRMTTVHVPQTGDEQADFDATLRAFTAGVSRAVEHEDFDSHYDLGVAFREMGLLEEAVVEFQRAALAPGRPLRALEAMAQCFLDLRQPEVALSTLAEPAAAASAAGVGDASLVAVHYLMGAAAQALGRPDDARRWFVRVVATDVRFRDAAARLAALPPPSSVR